METKQETPVDFISQIASLSERFISQVKTGEGLGLNEQQKKDFLEKMKNNGR